MNPQKHHLRAHPAYSEPHGLNGISGSSRETDSERRALVRAGLACWPVRGAQHALGIAAGLAAIAGSGPAQAAPQPGPAGSYDEAIRRFTGGPLPQKGKVKLDVAVLIDNGNTVPLAVTVDHPMEPDRHVSAIAVFSERNPQHEVLKVELGAESGRPGIATRIRLATSQKLMAVARLSDGTFWSDELDVIVTLAACIEGEP